MPKIGGKRKKARTHKETNDQEETSTGQKIPKSFILKRGDIPNPLKNIIGDLREVMYPHTAMKMRESSKNKLRDYIQIGGGFGVTHMVLFSATSTRDFSHKCKRDILSTQKKPRIFGRTLAAPLLIINGFNNFPEKPEEENAPSPAHYNIVNIMLQNMFPPLDLAKAKIYNTKKAVLFSLDHESDTIDFRYYGIKINQAGINKNIKQILELKKIPDLKGYKDISEYILRENDYMSENDMEDILEDDSKSKGDEKSSSKMTIKLYEIGPRLTLKLVKIEEGLMKGNVRYHRLIKKTKEQIEENRRKIKEKAKQKEKAKKQQEDKVKEKLTKKQQKKEELKLKKKFLEDEEDKKEKYEEDDGMNKEMEMPVDDDAEDEEEEKLEGKRKKPFDLSKGKVQDSEEEVEEEDEEGEGEEDDEEADEEEDDEYFDENEEGDEDEDGNEPASYDEYD